jgi:hypothetical protein
MIFQDGQILEITAAGAADLLRNNDGNRPIYREHVLALSKEDMELSLIRVDTNGRLVDGQHRCLACVESGRPFRAVVSVVPVGWKIPKEKAQSAADLLSRRFGFIVSTRTAGVFNFATKLRICTAEDPAALVRRCELAGAAARRLSGGGVALGAALLALKAEAAGRFADDATGGIQPAAAVLATWLAKRVRMVSWSERCETYLGCEFAVNRWIVRKPCSALAISRRAKTWLRR